MKDDDEEEENTFGVVRYPCMPSLVALQQMGNRLHLAFLGRKLMKWTALATGREMRRIAVELYDVYQGFGEDMRNAFILLARSRYFFPQLNHIVTEDIARKAAVIVQQSSKPVSGVKIVQFGIIETEYPPYEHLGIEKGGQTIMETKKAWLELLKRIIMMMQLRTSFIMVELANKNATKKWNVLSKLVIPRVNLSRRYIVSELEEIEREDNFRLKRFKELKIKKAQGTDEVCKKKVCTCEKLETGDGLDPCSLVVDNSNINTAIEKYETICCETDIGKTKSIKLDNKDKDEDLCPDCTKITPFPAKNVTDFQKADIKYTDVQELEYIFSACENIATRQENNNETSCGCQLLKTKDKLNKCASRDGPQGDNKKFEYIFEFCKKTNENICSCQIQLNLKDSETKESHSGKAKICCVKSKIINEENNKHSCDSEPLKSLPKVSFDDYRMHSESQTGVTCACSSSNYQQQYIDEKTNACCDKSIEHDSIENKLKKLIESQHEYISCICPKDTKESNNSLCICKSTQTETEISYQDRSIQTRSLSNPSCSCQLVEENKGNKESAKEYEYIFSSCKKKIRTCSDVKQAKVNKKNTNNAMDSSQELPCICISIEPIEADIKDNHNKRYGYIFSACKKKGVCVCSSLQKKQRAKSPSREDSNKYFEVKYTSIPCDKPIPDNSDISVCCQFNKSQVKMSICKKEIQTPLVQSETISKKESCVSQKEIELQGVQKSNTNLKTENKNVVIPCTSARHIIDTSTSPILISPCSKAAEKPCDKRSSILTIVSITSMASSERGSDSEEVTCTAAQTCSKCSSKNSVRKTKSQNTGKSSIKSGSSSCKIKIVSKSNDNSGQSSSYENRVELSPSTFNIIKKILCNLNNLEADNKSNELNRTSKCQYSLKGAGSITNHSNPKCKKSESKSDPCSCNKSKDLKRKGLIYHKPVNNKKGSTCSCLSKSPQSQTSACSCKNAENLNQSKERKCSCYNKSLSKQICSDPPNKSLKCACRKSRPKSGSHHKPKTLKVIDPSKSCTHTKSEANFNTKEKSSPVPVSNKSKSYGYSCSEKETNSLERFAFETKHEKELSSCPCNKKICNRKNGTTTDTNQSSCKQRNLNKTDDTHKYSCKSSVTSLNITISVMSGPDSDQICSKCVSSVSVGGSTTHDEDNSLSEKSLRFSDSLTRMKSCSCTTQTVSKNRSHNSSCLKSTQLPFFPKLESPNSCISGESVRDSEQILSKCSSISVVSVGSATHENNSGSQKSLRFSNSSTKIKSCSCAAKNVSENNNENSSCSKSCCPKFHSQDILCSKCSESKKDAATSTRRSDKYDVRPLRLLMETKKLACTCKSDSAVFKYKKPSMLSSRLLSKCCSLHDNQKYRNYQ